MPVLTPVLTPVLNDDKRSGIIVPPIRPVPPGDGGGSGKEPDSSFPISRGHLGMWILMTAVTMLFAGLSSAYIVLRGVPDWQNINLPKLIWVNTAILLASSVTIEAAKRALRTNRKPSMRLWLGASGVLGLGFLAGQVAVWRELVAAGVYLPSTLHSSFFYILTGLHGVHLLGGILGMMFVLGKAFQDRLTSASHESLTLCALYWHFMDAMWIYLFLLLILA